MGKRGRLPRKARSRGSRKGRAKRGSGIRPPRVHFGFTDLKVTGFGGAPLLADAAKAHGLPDLLGKAVSVKSRGRGATDAETMWAIVACLARGDGSLSDLNALRADDVARHPLGPRHVPEARRAGEWLARPTPSDVKGLWAAAVEFARRVAPAIVAHEVEAKGFASLFLDGTAIEVDGRLFERARVNCDGERGYRLHAAFIGGLWAAGQPQPGGGRVTLNWRGLLEWAAVSLPAGTPVWPRAEQTHVVVRRTERGGQRLLIPHHTVILVSRADLPPGDLVRGHRGKQGHGNAFKGPLRDMDPHHPPCRGCRANQGFHALGQIAHTPLRAVRFTALPKRAWGHGIRSVIRHVARTVAHMVGAGRRTWVRYAKTNLRLDWLCEAMMACEARAPPAARLPASRSPWRPRGGLALARRAESAALGRSERADNTPVLPRKGCHAQPWKAAAPASPAVEEKDVDQRHKRGSGSVVRHPGQSDF